MDDIDFEFDEFGSFEELGSLLDEDLSAYDLAIWFYALATVGYLNFHGKPSIEVKGADKIKYEFPPSTLSYINGMKRAHLLSETMDHTDFLPVYPIALEENFHSAFTDASLSSLLSACRCYKPGISEFLRNARGAKMKLY